MIAVAIGFFAGVLASAMGFSPLHDWQFWVIVGSAGFVAAVVEQAISHHQGS